MNHEILWNVRCISNRKTNDEENIGKTPVRPKIPGRWG